MIIDQLRVVILPGDYQACGLHRLINPAKALMLTEPTRMKIGFGDGVRAHFDQDGNVQSVPPVDADVLVLQRVMSPQLAQAIPHIQRQGVAVVVELDDDIERVDPRNAVASLVHPATSAANWRVLHQACQAADLVTVSTPGLLRYASHGRSMVLPNYVPAFLTTIGRGPNPADVRQVRLGWSGSTESHPGDLQMTRGQVGRVVAETGCVYRQVGNPDDVVRLLGLPKLRKIESTGWVELPYYPDALATLDVGIVPLADTAFNRSKTALKCLELAGVGVPAVVSPIDDNRRVAALGIGRLASRPRDWYRETRRLVVEHAYRQELSESGRAAVMQHATIEANAWRWAEAWNQAVINRRVATRASIHA